MAKKKIEFNQVLEAEYEGLFNTSQITPNHRGTIEAVVQRVLPNKNRYQAVVQDTGVPWGALAAVHNLESSLRFDRHLHNGDPLTARTRQVPANRPPASIGNPPFCWEVSAYDAIFRHKKWGDVPEWSQGRLLYEMERYNGFGYRLAHPEVYSPYLWSMTNHYLRGKFIADGVWSSTAVSKQVGACAVFRRLLELRKLLSTTPHRARPLPSLSQSVFLRESLRMDPSFRST
jgi:lysozyme family protein